MAIKTVFSQPLHGENCMQKSFLLSELYRDIYNLIQLQQFKDFILSQRCSHWSIIQKVISEKSSTDKLLDPNSKNGQAQHFQRLGLQDFPAKVREKNVADDMKLILN